MCKVTLRGGGDNSTQGAQSHLAWVRGDFSVQYRCYFNDDQAVNDENS